MRIKIRALVLHLEKVGAPILHMEWRSCSSNQVFGASVADMIPFFYNLA